MNADEIQGLCALHCALAKADGHKMDKAAMRYSAMADYVDHVAACGYEQPDAKALMTVIWDAVLTAIIGDPMNIPGKPFDRTPWRWMEVSP